MTTIPAHCMTIEELRAFLGFEKDRVIKEKVRAREWPHLRIGRKVRFSPAHVESILAMHEQGPDSSRPARPSRRRRSGSAGVDLSVLPLAQHGRTGKTHPG